MLEFRSSFENVNPKSERGKLRNDVVRNTHLSIAARALLIERTKHGFTWGLHRNDSGLGMGRNQFEKALRELKAANLLNRYQDNKIVNGRVLKTYARDNLSIKVCGDRDYQYVGEEWPRMHWKQLVVYACMNMYGRTRTWSVQEIAESIGYNIRTTYRIIKGMIISRFITSTTEKYGSSRRYREVFSIAQSDCQNQGTINHNVSAKKEHRWECQKGATNLRTVFKDINSSSVPSDENVIKTRAWARACVQDGLPKMQSICKNSNESNLSGGNMIKVSNCSSDKCYTQISNKLIQSSMSLVTIGFICKILSLPSDKYDRINVSDAEFCSIASEAEKNGFLIIDGDMYYFTDTPNNFSFRNDRPGQLTPKSVEPSFGLGREGRLDAPAEPHRSSRTGEADLLGTMVDESDLSPLESASKASVERSKEVYEAFNLYNQTAKKIGLPKCRVMTPSRKRSLALRLKEIGGLDVWKEALAKLEKSEFCQGKNDRKWRASMDFLLQPSKLAKLLEDGYDFKVRTETKQKTELQRLLENI